MHLPVGEFDKRLVEQFQARHMNCMREAMVFGGIVGSDHPFLHNADSPPRVQQNGWGTKRRKTKTSLLVA